nr:electron transfer flavoprotein subunit alpha [Prolixibacteraceae bacterium]
MNNVFVYIEIEEGAIAPVSFELLTKGRALADELGCKLEALLIGSDLKGMENEIYPYGVDFVHVADDTRLAPYTTLPHTSIICNLFEVEKPQIALMGATPIGRDLGPRVSSKLYSGLTADCTSLVIGEHEDKKAGKKYENLLYQIRPAFGGNIIATIINPECRPQMATVREGVMKSEIRSQTYKGKLKKLDVAKMVSDEDFVIEILERHIEQKKVNLSAAPVIVAGGYGMG